MNTKDGKRGIVTITPEKVGEVKRLIAQGLSQRQVASKAEVSQYTVWHVNKGTYDTDKPLQKVVKEIEFFAW